MDNSSMPKDGATPIVPNNNESPATPNVTETPVSPNDNGAEQMPNGTEAPAILNDNEAAPMPKDPESLTTLKDIGNEIIKSPFHLFLMDARLVFKKDDIGLEIARIALPAALALAADPIASLIDTAFIGHIGPVELAAVGVSIAIFNQVSRIAIFPLVSITTSFVAEEDAICESIEKESSNTAKALPADAGTKDATPNAGSDHVETTSVSTGKSPQAGKVGRGGRRSGKRHIPSVSTALFFGGVLGLVQAIGLIFGAKICLSVMGVHSKGVSGIAVILGKGRDCSFSYSITKTRGLRQWKSQKTALPLTTIISASKNSPMLPAAHRYLTLRSLGAPAVLLSLAMQGVFRGFKDTKTPLYATVVGDVMNIILDPILIFACRLGVSGAAIAHVVSQYLISLILFLRLMQKVEVIPPRMKDLEFGRFLRSGSLLLARVVAVTFCVTLAASLAARQGTICMAAFQICLQIWLTTSLLADGLAVAAQAMLASAFARGDKNKTVATTSRVLQLSLVLGFFLAVFLGVGMQFGWRIFTKSIPVMHLMRIGIPFVAATQPINSLAFVLDGVNFGASDFAYTAYSMVFVSIISIGSLFLLSSSNGFVGIWIALTIYMSLRTFAGFGRIGTATGPWKFLRR